MNSQSFINRSGARGQTAAGAIRPAEAGPRVYSSRELFGQAQEITIEHGGQAYRLKITRQGKLILNK
uniref:hemin uptake protein HemP n=1 Tax=Aquibium sp. A9E412 TaxID=2976767 RepID=UPI00339D5D78